MTAPNGSVLLNIAIARNAPKVKSDLLLSRTPCLRHFGAGSMFVLAWNWAGSYYSDVNVRIIFRLLAIGCNLLLAASLLAADDLPVKRVVLFTSGVGFFQRAGEVSGDVSVQLSFRTEQINDLLKSLVLQDLDGGRISPVIFASHDPIDRSLKSFAIDLTDNPPLSELLNRMRGVEVEVTAPKELQGVIVGVEKHQQKIKDEVIEVFVLNVMTAQGLRSLPLEQVQQIKLLDGPLDNEFRNALKVLATSHDKQRKPVTLNFSGQGKRHVSVSYILEAPIWKTSYRLELREKKPPFLQGWAIVENTTDEDWTGVNLTLVSGRPISFMMDLYQSLYIPRPTIVPETYASLRPPVYDAEISEARDNKREAPLQRQKVPAAPGVAGKALALSESGLRAAAAAAEMPFALTEAGVSAMAAAGSVGELFQYAIEQPVTVSRQKSAMIPIVNTPVEAEKVSIYNESVQRKFPLNGLRLTNTTGLHLMQGPITVFDGGVYAGDSRIEDLQPKDQRLLSYALDLKMEVDPSQQSNTNELTSIRIRKGVIVINNRLLQTKVYAMRNKAGEKRTLLVEHPFRSDWTLLEPPKPIERTPSVYRFRVLLDPDKSEKLAINEEQITSERIGVVNADLNMLLLYSRNKTVSNKVKEALERIVSMRNTLSDLERRSAQINQQINDISQEQTRIRDNMKVLAQNSELYNRYLKKFDAQETQVEGLREQLTKLRTDEETQRKQLDDYVSNLQLD